jgi:hypothetical protein
VPLIGATIVQDNNARLLARRFQKSTDAKIARVSPQRRRSHRRDGKISPQRTISPQRGKNLTPEQNVSPQSGKNLTAENAEIAERNAEKTNHKQTNYCGYLLNNKN